MEPMKFDANDDEWDQLLHQQYSPFVKLYRQMIIFSVFILVAHRNMISLYNLSKSYDDEDNSSAKKSLWIDSKAISSST